MLRSVLGIVLGCVAWVAVATLGNLVLRGVIDGYAAVEGSLAFNLPMLIGRLLVGLAATLASGYAVATVSGGRKLATRAFAVLLLLAFIPMHVQLWAKFPPWYHGLFLASLLPLALVGAHFASSQRAPRSTTAN